MRGCFFVLLRGDVSREIHLGDYTAHHVAWLLFCEIAGGFCWDCFFIPMLDDESQHTVCY